MSNGESFIEIKIDRSGGYKVFGPGGVKPLEELVNQEKLLNQLNSGVKSTFSNGIATYLETNSGVIWINGRPYYVP